MAEDESTIDLEEIFRIMFSDGPGTGQQIYISKTNTVVLKIYFILL